MTADGVALQGQWLLPSEAGPSESVVVVVASGAGIPARYYHRLATYLADRGAAVLTFDYRGIGASREGSLRASTAGMDDWAERDFGAALAEARETYPDFALTVVAHSVGTLFVGAAPDAARVSRLVLLGPHTGYWRDYLRRWRWLLRFVWHVLMPATTKLVGYFPGRALP